MTGLLLLVRHGNTFEPGATPTWVGARTDLPLTQQGQAQAAALAGHIARRYAPPCAVTCGPLRRTRETAAAIAASMGLTLAIEPRLTEIDYGLWENLSGAAIAVAYGPDELEAWEQRGVWPARANWRPSLPEMEERLSAFLSEQRELCAQDQPGPRVAVTSNGICRIVNRLITGQNAGAGAKVRTGALCALRPAGHGWAIEAWDERPEN